MKCQILFSGKNKKNISKYCLLKILPRVLSVKEKLNKIFEPVNNKTYNKTCTTREDSDQHAHHADRTLLDACTFYSLHAIQRGINEDPYHTGWVYRLICLCWSHRSYCRFCLALAHFIILSRIS